MNTILEGLKEIGKFIIWFALGFGVVVLATGVSKIVIKVLY